MHDIDNIVFDLGGVLVDLDRQRCIDRFASIGYAEADRLLDPYKQSGIFLELEEGAITPRQLYDHIRARVPSATPKAIDEALYGFLVDVPQTKLDMLLALRERYKVYMLSNTNVIMFPYILDRWFSSGGHTPGDYFDRMFLSYEMGIAKPDPEIFRMMASEAGMDPSRTLFIDDGRANTEAAAALGFRTYLASPKEDLRHLFE